jgi:hypothetical protein
MVLIRLCFPGRIDAAVECRIRHGAAAPDRCDEIVPAHHTVTILQEIVQEIEHLRLDRNQRRTAAQFSPLYVKNVIGKSKLQFNSSQAMRLKKQSRLPQAKIVLRAKPSPARTGILFLGLETEGPSLKHAPLGRQANVPATAPGPLPVDWGK